MGTLTVEALDLAYGADPPVLRGVTVAARPGELLAVTGTSGAGKTTLLSAMAGLLPARAGEVALDGAQLSSRDHAVTLGVVLIPQDNGLAAILTAAENISVAVIATGGSPAWSRPA
jgi:putative ABC transport system ATP-binding protein